MNRTELCMVFRNKEVRVKAIRGMILRLVREVETTNRERRINKSDREKVKRFLEEGELVCACDASVEGSINSVAV